MRPHLRLPFATHCLTWRAGDSRQEAPVTGPAGIPSTPAQELCEVFLTDVQLP
jgi:hypothetical protein